MILVLIRFLATLVLIAIVSGCASSDSAEPTPSPSAEPTSTQADSSQAHDESTIELSSPSEATAEVLLETTPESGSVQAFPLPTRGASAVYDTNNDDALNWAEYSAALRDAFAAYPWPPTYEVTADTILDQWPENDHASLFQPGFELNNINVVWSCAWMMTWLDSRNGQNPELEAQALEYIVNSLPDMVEDDYSRSGLEEVGQKAQIGDPSMVIQSVNANCSSLNLQPVSTP